MTQEQLDYLSSVKDVATKYALLSGDNSPVSYILEHGTDEQKHWISYNIPGGAAIDDTVAPYIESIRNLSSATVKTDKDSEAEQPTKTEESKSGSEKVSTPETPASTETTSDKQSTTEKPAIEQSAAGSEKVSTPETPASTEKSK